MTLELIQGLLLAFALVVILMPPYIRLLRHFGFAKQIREEGPQSHMVKWGTPTMGGLLIIVVVLGIFLLLRWPVQGGIIAPLATLAVGRACWARSTTTSTPGRARGSAPARSCCGRPWSRSRSRGRSRARTRSPAIRVPFVGDVLIEPWIYVPFAAFAIVAASQRRSTSPTASTAWPAARSRSRSSRS